MPPTSRPRGGCCCGESLLPEAWPPYNAPVEPGSAGALQWILIVSPGPGGETGRRKGLKILFSARRVWVQVPPRAPTSVAFLSFLRLAYLPGSAIRPQDRVQHIQRSHPIPHSRLDKPDVAILAGSGMA